MCCSAKHNSLGGSCTEHNRAYLEVTIAGFGWKLKAHNRTGLCINDREFEMTLKFIFHSLQRGLCLMAGNMSAEERGTPLTVFRLFNLL